MSDFIDKACKLEQKMRARLRLFKKIGQGKWLKTKASANRAEIGWLAGSVAPIAAEQHEGNAARNLPPRELIGLPPDDFDFVVDALMAAIEQG